MEKAQLEPEAIRVLTEAGWSPGRNIGNRVDDWINEIRSPPLGDEYPEPPSAVLDMLREFGGLMVSVNGPGHTMSRHPFFLDPREGLLEPNAYDQLSLVAECTAFPIGVLYGDRASIAGDDRGRVLLIESYGEALAGIDIHDALNRLIIGIRPEPF